MSGTTGTCFNVQRYSIHDGPGIRSTAFFKGCPLSCGWCHNPEGLSPDPEILFVPDRCIGCGACAEVCPQGRAVGPGRPPGCTACGRCVDVCHTGARRRVGESFTVDRLIGELERDRPFYEESGGGVTFSGGEPLLQGPFLLACLEECRARGLNVAIDTCGFAEPDLIASVLRFTNLFLFDVKILQNERHRRLTGVSLRPILENLRLLDEAGAEIWIRFPLVPGVTDDRANLEALGDLVASLKNTRRVHILPFHRTARDKYHRLGRSWGCGEIHPAAPPAVDHIVALLNGLGLEVRTGG